MFKNSKSKGDLKVLNPPVLIENSFRGQALLGAGNRTPTIRYANQNTLKKITNPKKSTVYKPKISFKEYGESENCDNNIQCSSFVDRNAKNYEIINKSEIQFTEGNQSVTSDNYNQRRSRKERRRHHIKTIGCKEIIRFI